MKSNSVIFSIFVIFFVFEQCSTKKASKRASSSEKYSYWTMGNSSFRHWLNNTLKTYDSRMRPHFGNRIMKISLRFWLIGISQISEKDMSFTAEMFFHETWTDPRLKFDVKELDGHNPLTLPSDAPELLWLPDTTFLNALKSTSPERGSVSHLYYMKLYNNGTITQSRRISVTAECRMDLTMYPFDKQACRLELSSYGWTVNDIIYDWTLDKDAINLKTISLQDYYVTRYMTKVVNRTFHAGAFSVPILCIELNRRSGFYFLQLIIPATAVVTMTWISLWLESETKFGDLVAVILAIIFLSNSYNTMMPKVSYVKAMDVYLAACFFFTFLSLAKLAIHKRLRQKVAKNKEKQKHEEMTKAAHNASTIMSELVTAVEPVLRSSLVDISKAHECQMATMIILEDEAENDKRSIEDDTIIDTTYDDEISEIHKFYMQDEISEIDTTMEYKESVSDKIPDKVISDSSTDKVINGRMVPEKMMEDVISDKPFITRIATDNGLVSTMVTDKPFRLESVSTDKTFFQKSITPRMVPETVIVEEVVVGQTYFPKSGTDTTITESVISDKTTITIPVTDKGVISECITEKTRSFTDKIHFPETITDKIISDTASSDKTSKMYITSEKSISSKSIIKIPRIEIGKRMMRQKSFLIRKPTQSVHPAHHDSSWRLMKAFHIISQLVLPLLFAAFGLFYFFIFPHFGNLPECT